MEKKIDRLLIGLIILDFSLATICLVSPRTWTALMHGGFFPDPIGLIRRMGAVWAAFFLLQSLALRRWRREPYWLVLVAGLRWSELFSDWVYWYFAERLSWLGHLGLLISPPSNLLFGIFLIRAYQKMEVEKPVYSR